MGQTLRPFHSAELQRVKACGVFDYTPQPQEEMLQLDTDVDQKGNTTVAHVFRRTREVYGQTPKDMKNKKVDWSEYITPLKNRPSPYDFPAFEHEERPKGKDKTSHEKSKERSKEGKKDKTKSVSNKEGTKEHTKEEAKPKSKEVHDKSGNKSAASGGKKGGGKKKPRVSHNKDLDHCSLED
ncbi:unnamed protein product [Bursaphelenchus okinawaensis]|uniref:Uncharacterized protein n=1 Tax=Bursaphelenchus okinawaensis TaxID=465554 RepID=A0A811JUT7_9BILA|nr:unnamed protein product [Bursaphelenchus okinawaensis]CAG9083541.1 unnamed protein product [Bursaphelenchus okinawaensis]